MHDDIQTLAGVLHSQEHGGLPILDPATLQRVMQLDLDTTRDRSMRDLIFHFADEADDHLREFVQAYDAGDRVVMSKIMLSMAEASRLLGATSFEEHCLHYEVRLRTDEFDDLAPGLLGIVGMYYELRGALVAFAGVRPG